jgi:hypothetical protein
LCQAGTSETEVLQLDRQDYCAQPVPLCFGLYQPEVSVFHPLNDPSPGLANALVTDRIGIHQQFKLLLDFNGRSLEHFYERDGFLRTGLSQANR